MKALIIGSEGNIGLPLVARLRARGWEVLESDIKPGWRPGYLMADINHPVDLLPAFDWKPDVVFCFPPSSAASPASRQAP
jgi:nucleoside-diphosphate-sugar epimerase